MQYVYDAEIGMFYVLGDAKELKRRPDKVLSKENVLGKTIIY